MDQQELDKHIKEISTAAEWINSFFRALIMAAIVLVCLLIYRKCL